MPQLKVGIIDLVTKGPTSTLYARIMHGNLVSIMPQVVAVWCEQEGHQVTLTCYTGMEDLSKELPRDVDVVFICGFTQAAFLAYALSNLFRSRGAVTVLGGPHARCYPDDARKYFDYVCGFTDREVIREILLERAPHRPLGRLLAAPRQPAALPPIAERWKYIVPAMNKAPFLKVVPMIGSMGCPYTCSFCIDSTVGYQPLDFEALKDDLRFVLTRIKNPVIGWHDPNFGIRFDDYMDVISSVAPPGTIRSIAETSLSILTEEHLQRMQENGIRALLPGIESWYEMGNKSRTARQEGEAKMMRVSEHVNMILRYIPYIQTNFVLGLDSDAGAEPFELTKQFVDRSPAAFPGYSLLTSFGEAAPINLDYQREGRLIPFPFHFLNNHLAMNLKPKNYEWVDFYDKVIDLTRYTFSNRAIYRRFRATTNLTSKWMNAMRAVSSEGYGRLRFYAKVRKNLVEDRAFRAYFEGETTDLPPFYSTIVKKDLGKFWEWLPEGALYHDPNAYLKKSMAKVGG